MDRPLLIRDLDPGIPLGREVDGPGEVHLGFGELPEIRKGRSAAGPELRDEIVIARMRQGLGIQRQRLRGPIEPPRHLRQSPLNLGAGPAAIEGLAIVARRFGELGELLVGASPQVPQVPTVRVLSQCQIAILDDLFPVPEFAPGASPTTQALAVIRDLLERGGERLRDRLPAVVFRICSVINPPGAMDPLRLMMGESEGVQIRREGLPDVAVVLAQAVNPLIPPSVTTGDD